MMTVTDFARISIKLLEVLASIIGAQAQTFVVFYG
jgi:hypothetical protein